VLADGVFDARRVEGRAKRIEPGLHHRGEQQPVAERRGDDARRLERGDHVALRRAVDRAEQRLRGAQQTLRKERRVHERLPLAREVHDVRRRGIDGAVDRGQREVAVRRLPRLDPRRDAREEPPERLEMRHVVPIGAGRLLHRHPRLQRAGREIGEHRIRQIARVRDPDFADRRCRRAYRSLLLPERQRSHRRPNHLQRLAPAHCARLLVHHGSFALSIRLARSGTRFAIRDSRFAIRDPGFGIRDSGFAIRDSRIRD
jgi:hypothetical protein